MINMETEMIILWLGLAALVAGSAYKIYKKYYLDDGKITLDEVGDLIDDIKEVVEDVTSKKE